jgi:hypothetical protein
MDTVVDNTLKIYQGADLVFPFTVLNAGAAADITGATFAAMFRFDYADETPALDIDTEITIVTAGSGTAKITVDNSVTAAIEPPAGNAAFQPLGAIPIYYDVNMMISTNTYRVLRGVGTFYRSALQ